MVCPTLESAMESLQSPPLNNKIESVFILGGTWVYEVYTVHPCRDSMKNGFRAVLKNYACDLSDCVMMFV